MHDPVPPESGYLLSTSACRLKAVFAAIVSLSAAGLSGRAPDAAPLFYVGADISTLSDVESSGGL